MLIDPDQYRLQTGRWEALHPEVYVVAGTPQSWHRDEIAAVFWAQGLAGGRAAGKLYELPGCDDAPIEVLTTLRHKVMPRCGVVVHLTKRLPPEQVVIVDGIPTTSIERTLLDLCGQLRRRPSAIALDNALFRGLTTIGDLDFCLYRTARHDVGRHEALVANDYRVLYVTWPDVTQYLQRTVQRIRQLRAERAVSRASARAHG